MSKLVFAIDFSRGKPSPLEAQAILSRTTARGCHHHSMKLRLPFGIYNVSIQRVADKVISLCRRLEAYFQTVKGVSKDMPADSGLRQEIVDYIELAIYAAAEHVDDVEAIAAGFFKDRYQKKKHAGYKTFTAELDKHRRFVSAAANNIKHQQARIRLYSIEFVHGPESGCLHGYFIEGIENGEVGPSGIFHQDQLVFSVSTLVWEIIVFVLQSSHSLARFLETVGQQVDGPLKETEGSTFIGAIEAAARLPNYMFGEAHPFERITLSFLAPPDESLANMDSGLYGSFHHTWDHKHALKPGGYSFGYLGDGISNKFKLVGPKRITLKSWGRPEPMAQTT